MTFFLFVGDMLVMAFMMAVVVWVYMKSSRESLQDAARIPLQDEFELEATGRPSTAGMREVGQRREQLPRLGSLAKHGEPEGSLPAVEGRPERPHALPEGQAVRPRSRRPCSQGKRDYHDG